MLQQRQPPGPRGEEEALTEFVNRLADFLKNGFPIAFELTNGCGLAQLDQQPVLRVCLVDGAVDAIDAAKDSER